MPEMDTLSGVPVSAPAQGNQGVGGPPIILHRVFDPLKF